jgi:endoglucanase
MRTAHIAFFLFVGSACGHSSSNTGTTIDSPIVDGSAINVDSGSSTAPGAADASGGFEDGQATGDAATESDAATGADADAAPASFVHAQGATLLDPNGQPLLLRGVNLGNWLEYEGYLWLFDGSRGDRTWEIVQRVVDLIGDAGAATFWQNYKTNYTTEADIARLATLGFNSVRVPMTASFLMPDGQDAFDDQEFGYLQNVVDWGAKHGIYVIFDMHAAPGGQNGQNIDNDSTGQPSLFIDSTNQDRLVALWTEIARRFQGSSAVAGYDLLNEPLPEPTYSQYVPQLYPLYQRVGQAIRTVDSHHMLIVEGANWADDWSSLGPPFDDNMAYSFHKYWDATDISTIQGYIQYRTMWMRPIWCGETGENDDSWYQAVFPLLESNDIGWAFWPWKKFEANNNPYSVSTPSGYSAIQAWVADATQPQPTPAAATATLNALLNAVQLSQCTYNQDVVCSMPPVVSQMCMK